MELPQLKSHLLAHRTITANGCWLYTGFTDRNGYGHYVGDYTHVWSAVIFLPHYNPKLNTLHKCDIPSCFNPDHLWQGTQRENIQDCIAKKRRASDKQTHCKRGHLLSGENLSYNNRGHRVCLACSRHRTQKWRNWHYRF